MPDNKEIFNGNVQMIILYALSTGDKYGYELTRSIADITKMPEIKQAELYNYLRMLEASNYISSYWGDESTGNRRRYFRITDDGKACIKNFLDGRIVDYMPYESETDARIDSEYNKSAVKEVFDGENDLDEIEKQLAALSAEKPYNFDEEFDNRAKNIPFQTTPSATDNEQYNFDKEFNGRANNIPFDTSHKEENNNFNFDEEFNGRANNIPFETSHREEDKAFNFDEEFNGRANNIPFEMEKPKAPVFDRSVKAEPMHNGHRNENQLHNNVYNEQNNTGANKNLNEKNMNNKFDAIYGYASNKKEPLKEAAPITTAKTEEFKVPDFTEDELRRIDLKFGSGLTEEESDKSKDSKKNKVENSYNPYQPVYPAFKSEEKKTSRSRRSDHFPSFDEVKAQANGGAHFEPKETLYQESVLANHTDYNNNNNNYNDFSQAERDMARELLFSQPVNDERQNAQPTRQNSRNSFNNNDAYNHYNGKYVSFASNDKQQNAPAKNDGNYVSFGLEKNPYQEYKGNYVSFSSNENKNGQMPSNDDNQYKQKLHSLLGEQIDSMPERNDVYETVQYKKPNLEEDFGDMAHMQTSELLNKFEQDSINVAHYNKDVESFKPVKVLYTNKLNMLSALFTTFFVFIEILILYIIGNAAITDFNGYKLVYYGLVFCALPLASAIILLINPNKKQRTMIEPSFIVIICLITAAVCIMLLFAINALILKTEFTDSNALMFNVLAPIALILGIPVWSLIRKLLFNKFRN